jgi:acyl carrier protein
MASTITAEQVEARITEAIASFGPDREDVTRDASFNALDVDSLDLVELAQICEEEFGVQLSSGDMPKLRTVGDAVDLVAARAGGS